MDKREQCYILKCLIMGLEHDLMNTIQRDIEGSLK